MKTMKTTLFLAAVMVASVPLAVGAARAGTITVGDFSTGTDGWSLFGDPSYPGDGIMSRVYDSATSTWTLQLQYLPTAPSTWSGYEGLATGWNSSGQPAVTSFSFDVQSANPWIIYPGISIPGVNGGANIPTGNNMFWPNSHYTYRAADFGVTAAQFATMDGIQFSMTPASATNGGNPDSTTGNLMFQISNVQLQTAPEPATLGLMGVGALGLLLIGRKRKPC